MIVISEGVAIHLEPVSLREDPQRVLEKLREEISPREGEGLLLVRRMEGASWRVYALACLRAVRAFEEGRNLGKTLETETLVCLAGMRQVSRAIEEMKPDRESVLIFIGRRILELRELLERVGASAGPPLEGSEGWRTDLELISESVAVELER